MKNMLTARYKLNPSNSRIGHVIFHRNLADKYTHLICTQKLYGLNAKNLLENCGIINITNYFDINFCISIPIYIMCLQFLVMKKIIIQ